MDFLTGLTTRQAKYFLAIVELLEENGIPPTMREIAKKLGIVNPTAAKRMVEILQEKGLIESLPGKARAIRLTEKAKEAVKEIME